MSAYYPWRIIPETKTVVVHERQKPTPPFGFKVGSGIEWKPDGPERRTRDKGTVDWAMRMRDEA